MSRSLRDHACERVEGYLCTQVKAHGKRLWESMWAHASCVHVKVYTCTSYSV